jgi:hypothetical protein
MARRSQLSTSPFFLTCSSLSFFSFPSIFQKGRWKKILGTKVLVQAISKAAGLGDEFPGPWRFG